MINMNKKMKYSLFGVIIVIACLTGLYLADSHSVSGKFPNDLALGKESDEQLTPDERAEKIVAKMTDSQKIGQLMMIGIQAPNLDQDARYMFTEFSCGNVILFDRNMQTPEQVKSLTDDIKRVVTGTCGVLPLIAVDQEGGSVMRMKGSLPDMPSAEAIGGESVETGEKWAVKTGEALRKIGINTNFAPVVDLDAAYHRSYGKTPEQVVPFAEAVIRGYTSTGIKTSLKHFPGIGKVKTDPHIDGDVVNITRTELEKEDGKPFRDLIAKTNPENTFIMVSNVTFPNLDGENPACLSKAIMTDLLRNDYGFKGLILSDDMEMGSISKHYQFRDVGVKAIEAGADIILVCHDYEHEQEVFNGLLSAYRNGKLDKRQIDEKVKRIIKIKLSLIQ